jgi:polar amino acid transport system substrate-binding protein
MKSGKINTGIILVAGVVLFFGNCATTEIHASESLIDEIKSRGIMKVGHDIFVPWSFKDTKGNLVGFEIDVATKLAEDMGVEVEFFPTQWSGIIPALLEEKFDVIIGGMGITTERAFKVNFTIPYNYFGMDCVVNNALLPGVTCLEDLNNEAVVIAVRKGASPARVARKYTPKARLHQFGSDPEVIQDVLNENAHAAFSSSPKPAYWAADYSDILYRPLGGEYITHDPASFAIRKYDYDALHFFNTWIRDNEDFLRDREQYWFHTKEWEYLLED